MEISRIPELTKTAASSFIGFAFSAIPRHSFSAEKIDVALKPPNDLEDQSSELAAPIADTCGEATNQCSSDSPDARDDLSSLTVGSLKSNCDNAYIDAQNRISKELGYSSVGAGLLNLGNTCFLNAILQCLTHTAPLVQGLRSCGHKLPCDRDINDFCILCVLHEQIEISLGPTGQPISPSKLVNNLHHVSPYFQRYQQEDAHELLQCLLNKLDTYFSNSESTKDTNLVQNIFGGRLISKLHCCNCDRSSKTHESFIDLSLDIEDSNTLQSALKSFTTIERIGGPGMNFTCEGCNQESSAEKQFLLEKSPPIAAFHFKRFKTEGFQVEKIDKHVSFPLELDLQPYSNNTQEEMKYELYGVVVHDGFSPNSGHYFSFIRSSPSSWFMMDDSEVTEVGEEMVCSQRAYIVFYAKKGTPWISSLMKKDPESLHSIPKSVLQISSHQTATQDTGSLSTSPKSVLQTATHQTVTQKGSIPIQTPTPPDSPGLLIESVSGKQSIPIHLFTPPGSPELVIESVSEKQSIPIHIHLPRPEPEKRSLEDPKRKEAMRLMRKTMPGARRMGLMAAMMEPHSEGSVRKSRKRMLSPRDDGGRRMSFPGSLRSLA